MLVNDKKNIVIVGSSGHAKVIIDTAEKDGRYKVVGLLDKFKTMHDEVMGYQILGNEEDMPKLVEKYQIQGVFVALGDNFIRSNVVSRVKEITPSIEFVSIIHPSASVATSAKIKEGSVVMPGVSINPMSQIGSFCILNTNSSLDHDSSMLDFASLAPNAVTGGNCQIGEYSAVGIGATLIHGVQIGSHSVIGAGSVVLNDIASFVVAYGSPAKAVRQREKGDKYL
jgi:sugar O-acyltransferase (sialic acid O-acetyltransferase NeuD family)